MSSTGFGPEPDDSNYPPLDRSHAPRQQMNMYEAVLARVEVSDRFELVSSIEPVDCNEARSIGLMLNHDLSKSQEQIALSGTGIEFVRYSELLLIDSELPSSNDTASQLDAITGIDKDLPLFGSKQPSTVVFKLGKQEPFHVTYTLDEPLAELTITGARALKLSELGETMLTGEDVTPSREVVQLVEQIIYHRLMVHVFPDRKSAEQFT